MPVLTDVHETEQCARVAQAVDVLQIPAFLCRQTDLLIAAAKTGKVVNVKKGQFLAPWDMKNVVAKITGAGNRNVLVTERGASFGYNTLVSDMRALPILARDTGAPVIFDATHSVQQPGGQGTSSGGEREFVPVLARAAVAVGVAGVFIETHQDPDKAPSDGPNMVPLKEMEALLRRLMDFDRLAKSLNAEAAAIPPVFKIVALVVFAQTIFTRAVDPIIPMIAADLADRREDRGAAFDRLHVSLRADPAGARRHRRLLRQDAADERLRAGDGDRGARLRLRDELPAAGRDADRGRASWPAACFRWRWRCSAISCRSTSARSRSRGCSASRSPPTCSAPRSPA